MRAIGGVLIAVAVILLAVIGVAAVRYGTADPCRATARLVQKDCPRFFSAQSCDDLKTMNEDRLTAIIRQQRGVLLCLRDLAMSKPTAQ